MISLVNVASFSFPFNAVYMLEDYYETLRRKETIGLRWSKHLSIILAGLRDTGSPLHAFRGHEADVVKKIYGFLFETWREAVSITPPAEASSRLKDPQRAEHGYVPYRGYQGPEGANEDPNLEMARVGRMNRSFGLPSPCERRLTFPTPTDRNVNMLPFIMGDKDSLPMELQPYYNNVISECPVHTSELGKVCYLTVSEGYIGERKTQRRAGLHIGAPNSAKRTSPSFAATYEYVHWGFGYSNGTDELHGGVFMASNLANYSAVWNALVDQKVVDYHGGMEYVRPFLGHPYLLAANDLVWMTDRTPHEALPQTVGSYRQFFRLVTSDISVWFKDHSTPNPKVPLPDFVKVIDGSKFAE